MAVRRFLTDIPAEAATRSQSSASAIALSTLLHAVLFLILGFTVFRTTVAEQTQERPPIAARLVYTSHAGGRSGPTGGDKSPGPRQMAQVVSPRALVAPAARPTPPPDPTPRALVPEPLPTIATVAPLVEVGVREAIGSLTELRLDGAGGPGNRPGPGTGVSGPGCCGEGGNKDGLGDGEGEQPGHGVTWPRLVREVKPNYTAEAMRAQIEGLVELDIVVLPDGSVGTVRIKRSLDARFGLDTEAIKAVRLWRFDPSRRGGKAVASRVGVELSFTLR